MIFTFESISVFSKLCNKHKFYDLKRQLFNKEPSSHPGKCGSAGWSVVLYNKGWQVPFLVGAHTQVVGSLPGPLEAYAGGS